VTHAAARHRALDRAFARAAGEPGGALLPSRPRAKDARSVNHDRKPSVLLAELWERRSGQGSTCFAGFMGNLAVALLHDGERVHPSRPGEKVTVRQLVAQEREGRPRTAGGPARG
jgi:hypothetical protein